MKQAYVLLLAMWALGATAAPSSEDAVRQLWQLLDYVAVDYAGAVANGAVVKPSEFAEMLEFSSTAKMRLEQLPAIDGKEALLAQADALEKAVASKSAPAQVASLAHALADGVLRLYPIPMAPAKAPDLGRGAAVFAQQCVACHGAQGAGDGPMAAKLTPPPIDFTDRERASVRSVLGLYQAVSQGVSGTSMPAFTELSDADRWAVAFYAGTLSHDDAMRQRGEAKWKSDPTLRTRFDSLAALTRSSESSLSETAGSEAARDLTAYLRSSPASVLRQQPTGLALTRARLRESLSAHQSGDNSAASRLLPPKCCLGSYD